MHAGQASGDESCLLRSRDSDATEMRRDGTRHRTAHSDLKCAALRMVIVIASYTVTPMVRDQRHWTGCGASVRSSRARVAPSWLPMHTILQLLAPKAMSQAGCAMHHPIAQPQQSSYVYGLTKDRDRACNRFSESISRPYSICGPVNGAVNDQ